MKRKPLAEGDWILVGSPRSGHQPHWGRFEYEKNGVLWYQTKGRTYLNFAAWYQVREIRKKAPQDSYECIYCEAVSYSPKDLEHRYCHSCGLSDTREHRKQFQRILKGSRFGEFLLDQAYGGMSRPAWFQRLCQLTLCGVLGGKPQQPAPQQRVTRVIPGWFFPRQDCYPHGSWRVRIVVHFATILCCRGSACPKIMASALRELQNNPIVS